MYVYIFIHLSLYVSGVRLPEVKSWLCNLLALRLGKLLSYVLFP